MSHSSMWAEAMAYFSPESPGLRNATSRLLTSAFRL